MNQNQFERFNLKSYILDAVATLGFKKPTEIQERVIPAILNDYSLIGQSQTGTGKTHSYLLPIMNKTRFFKSRSSSDYRCTNPRIGESNL